MSEAAANDQNEVTDQSGEPKPRVLMKLVKAVVFVSVIVVVEVVGASMIVPSTEDTTKLAHQLAAASHGHDASSEKHEEGHDEGVGRHDLHEVELGTFHITRYNPTTGTTLAIDFELYGTVLASEESNFSHTYEHSKARVREQITMTMHNAESSDLTDAGLGLIKRQILAKTNRAIGEPLLKEVLFSKFNFVER